MTRSSVSSSRSDARRSRRCERHRRGRSSSAPRSRSCTRGRCGHARLLAYEIVDFELGAVVDAAHRVVHQHDSGVRAERAREQRLLLIPPESERMLASTSGVRILMRAFQLLGECAFALGRKQQAGFQLPERADADVLGDRPLRKHAVGLPIACHQRDRRVDLGAARRRPAASKTASSKSVCPWPARPAGRRSRPPCDEFAAVALSARDGCAPSPEPPPRASAAPASAAGARTSTPPIAPIRRARSKERVASATTTLPSRMTTMRSVAVRTSPRICEISAQLWPAATARRI